MEKPLFFRNLRMGWEKKLKTFIKQKGEKIISPPGCSKNDILEERNLSQNMINVTGYYVFTRGQFRNVRVLEYV
jgi:hypothetical protein